MPQISRITNVNKLVEEKVNYFLDRIIHSVDYAGWHWHLELESPSSLIEKILFRLQKDPEYRLEYLENYLKREFFSTDAFWVRYPAYCKVKKVVDEYIKLGKKQRAEKIQLVDSASFQANLTTLHRDLIHKMPEDLINAVLSNVLCKHHLEDMIPDTKVSHASFFNNAALILASEYYFRGYSKKEIKDIISKVFSKDVSKFPFPSRVKTKTQRKNHLIEGRLGNQLHGFTNAFKQNSQKGVIIVKVYGGAFPDDFEMKYDRVRFYGKNHPTISRIKKEMSDDGIQGFFTEGEYIVAATEVTWHSIESLLRKLKSTIRKELIFLSAILDRDFSVDTTNNFIRLSLNMRYKGMTWGSRQFNNKFTVAALGELNDNGFQILRKVKGQAVEWFLKCESLFVTAYKNSSISDYWLYLETLLSFNRPDKEVKGLVSSIILSNEKFLQDKRILETFYSSFDPLSGGFHLLKGDRRKVYPALRTGKVRKEIRNIEYPFIKALVKEFDEKLDSIYYKKAKNYYYNILTETYEYRNFFVHRGLENDALRDKLLVTLPNIIIRARWIIFDALKKGMSDSPFDLLIDALAKKGDTFLK